mmetsp:Transcript_40328/g.115871  ORF Transcript_40328/g.115871 Transcript_40328/m.115871 type:complete len:236 (+) Transcript_40328:949-1656(+)
MVRLPLGEHRVPDDLLVRGGRQAQAPPHVVLPRVLGDVESSRFHHRVVRHRGAVRIAGVRDAVLHGRRSRSQIHPESGVAVAVEDFPALAGHPVVPSPHQCEGLAKFGPGYRRRHARNDLGDRLDVLGSLHLRDYLYHLGRKRPRLGPGQARLRGGDGQLRLGGDVHVHALQVDERRPERRSELVRLHNSQVALHALDGCAELGDAGDVDIRCDRPHEFSHFADGACGGAESREV